MTRCFSPSSSAVGEGQSCELVAPYDIEIAPEALRSACQTRYRGRKRGQRLFSRRCYQDDSLGTVREVNLRESPTEVLWHLIRSTCNETRKAWDESSQNLPSSAEVATKGHGQTGLDFRRWWWWTGRVTSRRWVTRTHGREHAAG